MLAVQRRALKAVRIGTVGMLHRSLVERGKISQYFDRALR